MDIFAKAISYFGTTNDFNETGYILPDGTLLDFSEKQNGGMCGMRTLDHREVAEILHLPQTESLIQFMNDGCIRVMPESPGLDISVPPTSEQLDMISEFVNYYGGEIYVDFSDMRGNNVGYFVYPANTASSRVISDITTFFEKHPVRTA